MSFWDKKPVAPKDKVAMLGILSNYTLTYIDLEDEIHVCKWQGPSLQRLMEYHRPITPVGINYMSEGERIIVPWHQLKKASLVETPAPVEEHWLMTEKKA